MGSPHLLQPSKWLSPDVNRFFGTGAIDSIFNGLLRKVFPKLPMNPSFVRRHGVQDAVQLGEMFNNGKMHVDVGNLSRGRPVVSNSAFWGMDDGGTKSIRGIANVIADKSEPKFPHIEPYSLPPNITNFLKSGEETKKFIKLAVEKLKNEQKQPKNIKSTVKTQKSDDKNKKNPYLSAAGTALGGGLMMLGGSLVPGALLMGRAAGKHKALTNILSPAAGMLKQDRLNNVLKAEKSMLPGDFVHDYIMGARSAMGKGLSGKVVNRGFKHLEGNKQGLIAKTLFGPQGADPWTMSHYKKFGIQGPMDALNHWNMELTGKIYHEHGLAAIAKAMNEGKATPKMQQLFRQKMQQIQKIDEMNNVVNQRYRQFLDQERMGSDEAFRLLTRQPDLQTYFRRQFAQNAKASGKYARVLGMSSLGLGGAGASLIGLSNQDKIKEILTSRNQG
jgi:hypothetical protein